MNGYRETFSPNTTIPKEYQDLVLKAILYIESLSSPSFLYYLALDMLIKLRDIFQNFNSGSQIVVEYSDNNDNITPSRPSIERKWTIANVEKDCPSIPNFNSFDSLSVDEAIEKHKKDNVDKMILYKCFDAYANMGNPKAKCWKAYYISKGWSTLTGSKSENLKTAVELYKEVADYGNDFSDAQLQYATMLTGVQKDVSAALEYYRKAADNGNVVAMFTVGTHYISTHKNEELGKYYLITAANKIMIKL
jgi:TPR repeat protein